MPAIHIEQLHQRLTRNGGTLLSIGKKYLNIADSKFDKK